MATTNPLSAGRLPQSAGIGLRLPHVAEVVATTPAVGWVEVHPENFMANPHATELLCELRGRYPISVHTVGVSIGSADGIDMDHLRRLRQFVDLVDPVMVSGHLAWSTHHGTYLNDLLPLPYTNETLELVGRQLDIVQDALARRYLVENPSTYVAFNTSTMTELQFLNELVEQSRCKLLCDISNVYLSARNMGYDAAAFIDALPTDAVEELHLGGFTAEEDEATPGATLLVDTHAASVADGAWDLYAHAVRRFGARPTIIEWDSEIPSLGTLIAEAEKADRIRTAVLEARGVGDAC